jgi:hypothetical protein
VHRAVSSDTTDAPFSTGVLCSCLQRVVRHDTAGRALRIMVTFHRLHLGYTRVPVKLPVGSRVALYWLFCKQMPISLLCAMCTADFV